MSKVMTFTKDEQETVILYDHSTDTWSIETNVQRHIGEVFRKYNNYDIKIHYVNESGNPTAISVSGIKKAISFRTVK